jgi:AraC-like DNA-binding protein
VGRFMTSIGIHHYNARERMIRHRHADGYVALILAGGYVEAGDAGRIRAEAGQVLIHQAYESHQNAFSICGATVLNLPLADRLDAAIGKIDDVDAVVRLAERDPPGAAQMLRCAMQPLNTRLQDWPDQLAAALASEADFSLGEWARRMRLAPQSLSRGFRCAYGTTPKRYRVEQRALRAIRALRDWRGSLAALAAETGFADQAHFTRAVGMLTGVAPNRLRVKYVQEATQRCR